MEGGVINETYAAVVGFEGKRGLGTRDCGPLELKGRRNRVCPEAFIRGSGPQTL